MTTWTQIDSKDSPTAGVFDFASLTLTGYQVLQVVCTGITVTTDGTDVKLTFYVAGSEVTSGYRWGINTYDSGGTANADGSASAAGILLCSDDLNWDVGNAAGESFGAIVTVDTPLSATLHKRGVVMSVSTGPSGFSIASAGTGVMENAGAITGLKVSGTSNLTAGKVRVLGLA